MVGEYVRELATSVAVLALELKRASELTTTRGLTRAQVRAHKHRAYLQREVNAKMRATAGHTIGCTCDPCVMFDIRFRVSEQPALPWSLQFPQPGLISPQYSPRVPSQSPLSEIYANSSDDEEDVIVDSDCTSSTSLVVPASPHPDLIVLPRTARRTLDFDAKRRKIGE